MPELEAGVVIGVGTTPRAPLELYRSNALRPEIIFLLELVPKPRVRGEKTYRSW